MNKQNSAVFFRSPRFFLIALLAVAVTGFFAFWLRSGERVQAQQQNEPTSDAQLAPALVVFSENFDGVTAPALPAGWAASRSGEIDLFKTVTAFPDSPPNAVFVNDPNMEGTSDLISPTIALGNLQHKLSFTHFYQTDFEFDGCVLEISVAGGAFQDIVTAGGSFITGGYDTPMLGGTLAGRRAWTGQQSGYILTEINLPASTINQNIRLRWRIGTDPMEAGTGWRIDNVRITNDISGANVNAIAIPATGIASPYPSEVNISGFEGFVTGVQVALLNFSHTSPDDVDLMLVAPNGRYVVLMSDVGGTNAVSNLNLLISDAATASLPDSAALTSGTYRPTNFEPENFPTPAPQGMPAGAKLSSLNGSDPNGTWRLYLVDDNGNNAGTVSGGWQLFLQSSTDAISIPEIGAAQPYASEKRIAGMSGTVTKATLTLSNFSHSSPDDVDIMLVAPNNRSVVVMSDVGGGTEVGSLNITLDDDAPGNLPDAAPLTSGTFKPTNFETGDAFPLPAPQGSTTGATMNTFFGSSPNGVWKLFAVDDNGQFAGSIGGSWSLNLQTSTSACAFTLQPLAQAFPVTGGSGSFAINMPEGCSWSAATNAGFITINSNTSGSGNGSLSFSVAPNMGGGRAGTIDISNGAATRSFQVQQPSGCPFSISQTLISFASGGGSGSIPVTAGSGCAWQATSSANWVQVTSSQQQTGNGNITFNVQPNTTQTPRSATISVGTFTVTVNQTGAVGRRFDFDGDGKADISVFRPSDAVWYLLRSQAGFTGIQFGLSTDKLAPADYDGDGKTDLAVVRGDTWHLQRSSAGFTSVPFGAAGDVPQPADFDGDGRAELAVFRPANGTWYFLNLVNNQTTQVQFGANGDRAVVGDYDGDGKADPAVYRAGVWYMLGSQAGFFAVQFGITADKPVSGDYDGDGRTDQAVYRDGTWYILGSSQGFTAGQFGIATDLPAPADYDGDGKTDLAVYRQNTWYLMRSTQGFTAAQFGTSGDKPVPNAFVP